MLYRVTNAHGRTVNFTLRNEKGERKKCSLKAGETDTFEVTVHQAEALGAHGVLRFGKIESEKTDPPKVETPKATAAAGATQPSKAKSAAGSETAA